MPLDASRNPLVLPLLGLLVEQPAHAYDLTARLRDRYGPALSPTRSTVTSLLKALERNGLVAAERSERVGKRPLRTVYEVTGAGVEDMKGKVVGGLRNARVASPDFALAVAYVGILPVEEALSIVDARVERLDEQLGELDPRPEGVAEVHMLEVAYWRTIVTAELGWLTTLAQRMRSGDLDWTGGDR
ncbi:PadR family transcriptional regulator [Saccharothrix variisporea]|uniref:PadR family transcriptional regulator n=1 Tax=Saccharothrix variisporea TaxID=543527 RepID=A0A495XP33_9PSEU|nr:helix-turn-helix transcriptional regulator [Saccharothrix variisporea]RKT74223.1 PadR family transcriptional regulator [Saccharothrix variisporea]